MDPNDTTWTHGFFVKDQRNEVIHHEIVVLDGAKMTVREQANLISERLNLLYEKYPLGKYDVFHQTFDSLATFYRSWPELKPPSKPT
jgi:hypothetical protein